MTTWAIFLLIIYALHDIFDIIIVTFILSYIAKNIVEILCRHLGPRGKQVWVRRIVVVAVFVLFVAGLVTLGKILVPTIYRQTNSILHRFSTAPADSAPVSRIGRPAEGAGPPVDGVVSEVGVSGQPGPAAPGRPGENSKPQGTPAASKPEGLELNPQGQEQILKDALRQWLGHERYESFANTQAFDLLIRGTLKGAASKVSELTQKAGTYVQKIVTLFSHFLISIVFSFMIVWDLPKLEQTTIKIPEGRFRDFCREIIPSLLTFSSVMGRALQAQTLIALCNTILTFLGLTFLGIENEYFLSVIVFLCSFIPVLGVFLSTLPMSIVALQQSGGGFGLVFHVILMVTLLHLIEAYVLNPRIMGIKFKMNPIVVVVILLVGEHFFGVYGLLLGVPLCYYLLYYVIQGNDDPSIRSSGLWRSLYPEGAAGSPETPDLPKKQQASGA